MSIHIGKIIKEEFQKRGCSKSWFAIQINCDRTNINKIFERQSIDTDLLLKISKVLEVDLFQYYQNEINRE
jgi:plasmid maintenance system antidote protein VapI